MALSLATLKDGLERDWMVPEGGAFPPSTLVSAQRFAAVVSRWFGAAQANGLPCSTAAARELQLAALAAGALQLGEAEAVGAALAGAVAAYIAGQSFGPGVATGPVALPLAAVSLGRAFADLDAAPSQRAQSLAEACQNLAVTTPVSFPTPPFVGPIT